MKIRTNAEGTLQFYEDTDHDLANPINLGIIKDFKIDIGGIEENKPIFIYK